MKRIIYFAYYLKNLDRKTFIKFLNYASSKSGRYRFSILLDCIVSVFIYNISILEYFQFGFFDKKKPERLEWAGTGFMYEFQLKMNPIRKREILDNKDLFYKSYKQYIKHTVAEIEELRTEPERIKRILSNKSGKLVFKAANGKCGAQVLVQDSNQFGPEDIIPFMEERGYDVVEDCIIQHPSMDGLSPSGVNTIRIFTQLNKDDNIEILGCRLRISVNCEVDNMAAGNIAVFIDEKTGVTTGPGVYSDITKNEEETHPVTRKIISGFKVPFWEETIKMVKSAASLHPENRSVGWDIAITENGPYMIEGNHDWCKLLYQLPARQGLKPVLEKHLNEYLQKHKST